MQPRVPRASLSARVAAVSLLSIALAAASAARAERRVFLAPSATGNGSGSDAANAMAFDANFIIYRALADNPDPVVDVHLAPGTYSLRTFLFSPASRDRERLSVRLVGDGARPEDTVIRNDKPLVAGAEDRMARINGLGRIELENLTFDGNWDEKTRQAGHAAFNPNYKNHPLNLTARTGRVRRVIVRNCGSVGYLPQTRFDNVAGTEAFPLAVGTTDVGQEPAPGDPAPWVVEDCEVHGFHPEYGGYTTMVMAGGGRVAGQTPDWAATEPGRRMVLVRRCQVRGVPGGAGIIALGSAGCDQGGVDGGRVTYTDDVVLNASLGFNTDCGRLVDFVVTNSVFADVWTVGNVGALYPGMMDRYRVSGNLVRLAGRAGHPTYLNYAWKNGRQVTDPALVLGRHETNEVIGIGVGAAGQMRWEGNWFTTRPRSQFAPEGTDATFRLFRKYTAADTAAAGGFADIAGLEAGGNALSSAAWDFARPAALPGGSHARFGADTVPELTRLRPALDDAADDFKPFGTVERVVPRWVERPRRWTWRADAAGTVHAAEGREPVLSGMLEASLGRPRIDARGDLRLSARLAFHPMPGSGTAGTQPVRGASVAIEATGPLSTRLAGTTDSRGLVEFRVPAAGLKPGVLQLRAVHEPDARPDDAAFHEYRSAFATASFPVGTVVTASASPDFAQAGGQRGRFVLSRPGRTTAELPELEVYFRLGSDGRPARWGDDFVLAVPAGTKANLDPLANGGVGRLTFAAGERTVALEVEPRARAFEGNRVVSLRLLPGPRQSYGAPDAPATVFLHCGAEWALELLPAPAGARVAALGNAYNAGPLAVVHAVGSRRDAAGRESGAVWRWTTGRRTWDEISGQVTDFAGVLPAAVGRASDAEVPELAGNRASGGGTRPWAGGGRALPVGPGIGSPRVLGMSDDTAWIVGVSGQAGSRRPVAWRGQDAAIAPALPTGVTDAEPAAIDPAGRIAGNARRGGHAVAFRTAPEGDAPWEFLPGLPGDADAHVSDLASSGVAVGWSGTGDARRAVAWPPRATAAVELSRMDSLPNAMAFGVNPSGEAIAMAGGPGRALAPYLVMAVAGGAWKPLDDPHFVAGIPPGFEWGAPVSINDQGWIAGNGRVGGREVAWVLRRQRPRGAQ